MSSLTAWERMEIVHNKNRPTVNDYIPAMFTRFMEFHGDRYFGDDCGDNRRYRVSERNARDGHRAGEGAQSRRE